MIKGFVAMSSDHEEYNKVSEIYNRCKICHYENSLHCPEKDKTPINFKTLTKEEIHNRITNPEIESSPFSCESLLIREDTTSYQLADFIMNNGFYKTFKDTKETLFYYEGIYKSFGDIEIESKIEKHFPSVTSHKVNETLAHIKRKTYIDRCLFDSEPYYISVENGVLDLLSDELNPPTPNYLSLVKIPIYYDKEAKCEAIDKFLSEIVAKEDVQTLYEIAGFLLLKKYFIHKAIMQIGETHSGKSTYQKLLCAMIGEKNVSHVPLQNLLYHRFASAQLYGKLMNSYADLPNITLKQTGPFKMLCGEDMIYAEKKGKNPFEFENTAKLIFSCNEMPKTHDKSDAFYIRWILINFPNRFDDKNPNTDKKLIEKLTTKEELSGFLNKAIEYAKILIDQEHFTNNPDVEIIKEYYEKLSNPIYAFMMDFCIIDGKSNILCEAFYQELMKYCEEKRLSKPTLTYLTQELKRLRIEKTRLAENKRPYAYHGLRWKTDKEKIEDITLDEF